MLMLGVAPPLETTGEVAVTSVTPVAAAATMSSTVAFFVTPLWTRGISSVPASGVVAAGRLEIFTSAMMLPYSNAMVALTVPLITTYRPFLA